MNTKTKKITLITVVLLLCIVFTCCLVACGDPNKDEIGDYAYNFLSTFNNKFNARKAGSAQEYAAAEYITNELESFGYDVKIQPFSYTKNVKEILTISTYAKNGMIVTVKTVVETENEDGTTTKTITDVEGDKGILIKNQKITSTKSVTTYSQNVVAVKEGSDTSKQIIVGAHYGSVTAGYGIDDNASGVSAMLETAKYYSDKTPSCNIVFIAFGAEETGCNGSAAYVKKMTDEEKAKTKLMINIDSIAGGDKLYAYTGADEESQSILADLLNYGKDLGLVTQEGKGKDYGYGETGDWSDHANFKNAGIKFIYFEGTNWDCDIDGGETQYVDSEGNGYKIMHTSKDTLDWIEENFPGRAKKNVSLCVKSIINLTE